MVKNKKLAAVIAKYRTIPEFLGLDVKDVNQPGHFDDTLLHVAARTGASEEIIVLIAAGARINAVGDLGNTPLHGAAMSGQKESVRLLLESGADPNIKNEFGQTALEVAELGDHSDTARLLKPVTKTK